MKQHHIIAIQLQHLHTRERGAPEFFASPCEASRLSQVAMAPIPFDGEGVKDALSNLAKRIPTSLPSLLDREASPAPTPTTSSSLLSRILHPRATTSIIPTGYGSIDSGPAPGTVVGIVLGSVGGFLLVLWLFYTCINFGGGWGVGSTYTESVVVRERDRRKSHHGSHRSRRASEVFTLFLSPFPTHLFSCLQSMRVWEKERFEFSELLQNKRNSTYIWPSTNSATPPHTDCRNPRNHTRPSALSSSKPNPHRPPTIPSTQRTYHSRRKKRGTAGAGEEG